VITNVALNEVVEINMGAAPPGESYNTEAIGIPMIAGAGDYGEVYPVPKKWTTEPTRISKKGDLVICVRATIGDLNWSDNEYCLGRGVASLRAKEEKLDSRYLAYYMDSSKTELTRLGTGSTFLAIRKGDLENFKIPLPTLTKQKRIVTILDQADAIRKKRQQAIKELINLIPAIFYNIFGNPIIDSDAWPMVRVEQLGNIVTGSTPPGTSEGMYGGEIPFMTPGDLESSQLCKRTLTEAGTKHSRIVRSGSTLVCCIGATIGKTDIVSTLSAFNQQINAIEWNDKIDDFYGYYAMSLTRANVIKAAIKTTLPILKKSSFSLLKIPVPPIGLQQDFSKKVNEIQNVEIQYKKSAAKANDLFNSLVQRAFKGEL